MCNTHRKLTNLHWTNNKLVCIFLLFHYIFDVLKFLYFLIKRKCVSQDRKHSVKVSLHNTVQSFISHFLGPNQVRSSSLEFLSYLLASEAL